MRIFRSIAMLGTLLSTISAVRRLVRQHRASKSTGPLFGDVKLPRTATSPHFPEALPPRP
jgi:hypothetical protein